MADRYGRIKIFEETMELCRTREPLARSVRESISGQQIVWQEDPLFPAEARYAEPATLLISTQRTLEAAEKYAKAGKRVCVLNFASCVTPGGGVTRGSAAQEESLCRISTLYPAISDQDTAGAFYDRHWQLIHRDEMSRKNRDDCIFTPGVVVIREDTFDCALLEQRDWYSVDVITCAAPDQRYADAGRTYRPSREELTEVFEKRWQRILSVAAQHDAEVLILGAFGCGAFHNPPEVAAQAFEHIFKEFECCFEKIVFAVFAKSYETENYQAFAGIQGIQAEPD